MEEDELSIVEQQEKARPDMTRSVQTLWILGAMAVALWVVGYFMTRLPDANPYAKCQRIIGPMDDRCKSDVAIGILNRSY